MDEINMCHCTPEIRTPCCGATNCYPTGRVYNASDPEPAIDKLIDHARQISRKRSQEVLKEKGRQLSFDDLLAAVYFQAVMDTRKRESDTFDSVTETDWMK